VPFLTRYPGKDSPQALLLVDQEGIIRYAVQTGPNAQLPGNAEILRRLKTIG
jgi:hypothetical protein